MTYALEIKKLNKTYSDGTKALLNVDLNVEKGDFFGLMGPNGAGKTTLIGIITDLVNKTSGSVKVFGKDIEKNKDLKSLIGLVPQEINFTHFEPVEEIIVNFAGYHGIPRSQAKKRAETILKELDLWEKRKTPARLLSGGMKRRLMIARALMTSPTLLFLDEPTAGVDVEIRRSMWEYLNNLNKNGITIILTTHYLEEVEQFCKNVAIINKGKIIENTSVKKLISKLSEETLILDLVNPISKLPKLNNSKVKIVDKSTIEIVTNKKNNINELFLELSKNNIEVKSMRNKTNRLEELFLKLIK